jgi:hypothetical protein
MQFLKRQKHMKNFVCVLKNFIDICYDLNFISILSYKYIALQVYSRGGSRLITRQLPRYMSFNIVIWFRGEWSILKFFVKRRENRKVLYLSA